MFSSPPLPFWPGPAFWRLALLLAFPLAATAAPPAPPRPSSYPIGRESGEAIMAEARLRHEFSTEVLEFRLQTISRTGESVARDIVSLVRRESSGRLSYLLHFLSPEAVAGTALLFREEADGDVSQWLHLPALGETRRITGEAAQASFLGSDFTYEDLQKESVADYEYTLAGESRFGGRPVFRIVARPDAPGRKRFTGYARRLLLLDQETLDVLRIEFFTADNRHEKDLVAEDYDSPDIDGHSLWPRRAVMSNLRQDTTTVLTLRRSRLNLDLPAAWFTPESFSRLTPADFSALFALPDPPN